MAHRQCVHRDRNSARTAERSNNPGLFREASSGTLTRHPGGRGLEADTVGRPFDTREDFYKEDFMTQALPAVYLARHRETATLSGQHTGRKDLPLTSNGERNASQLGQRLGGLTFGAVFTSPLQRARRTCELAGFGSVAQVDPDLVEWDYGVYEGRRLEEILAERPDWNLFRDGCPGGETPAQIGARADRVVERIRNVEGNVLLFSSGHFLRILADRWMNFAPGLTARHLLLSTDSLSILSYERNLSQPVIRLWNNDHHVTAANIATRETSAQVLQPARSEEGS